MFQPALYQLITLYNQLYSKVRLNALQTSIVSFQATKSFETGLSIENICNQVNL